MNDYSSLWLNNENHFKNSLNEDFECDVAIVGGGVSGISTAYHLLGKGLRVAVFEMDVIGSGSTGHSGGFLAASAIFDLSTMIDTWGEEKGNQVYRATIDAITSIEDVVNKEKIICDFKKYGALYVGTKPSHFSYLEEEFDCLEKLNAHIELMKPDDSRIPIAGVYGALKTFEDASLNPVKFLQRLCDLLVARGTNIFTNTKIVSIKDNSTGVTLKDERGHVIKSKYVVLASNGISASGKKDPSTIEYTSHIAITKRIEGIEKILKGELVWNTDEIYNYLRLINDNRILIGGEDSWFGKINKKHTRENSIKQRDKKLLKKLQLFFPQLSIEIESSWVGTLTCPLDGLASIKESEHTFTLITECIPFGWLLGQIVMEKITNVPSEYDKLFSYKRNYGFFQNIIIHAPLPQSLKNLIVKLGRAFLVKINS